MPTEHLGHIHHSGNYLCYTPVFMQIIVLRRWAVERLAFLPLFGPGVVTRALRLIERRQTNGGFVCDAPIGSGMVRAGA